MQRHGWTFCLGLLLTGMAAAQPPAEGERYPPAPDLPGVLVGTSVPPATKLAGVQPSTPAPRNLEGVPTPAGPEITATTEPVGTPVTKPGLPAPAATTMCRPRRLVKPAAVRAGAWDASSTGSCSGRTAPVRLLPVAVSAAASGLVPVPIKLRAVGPVRVGQMWCRGPRGRGARVVAARNAPAGAGARRSATESVG